MSASSRILVLAVSLLTVFIPGCPGGAGGEQSPGSQDGPSPRQVLLDSLLEERRSVRSFADSSLTADQAYSLMWACYGTTGDGRRTVPSAGATYPLRILVVCGRVEGIRAGVYRYNGAGTPLSVAMPSDVREALAEACLDQPWVSAAPACIVITGDTAAISAVYGDRSFRYMCMEAGHAAQNLYLECAAMGLGTVAVGAFDDRAVAFLLGLSGTEIPLYVMPVGVPAAEGSSPP